MALDLLFVMGLGMGAGGAALATVLSQGVSFVTNFLSDIAVMGPAPQPADELAEQTEAAPEKTNTGKAVS